MKREQVRAVVPAGCAKAARGSALARRGITALALAAALAAAGCAMLGGSRRAGAREVAVAVENQNFYDATIYALDGGARRRLGIVTGNSKKLFTFPWPSQDLRFQIDFIGGVSHTTHSLPVTPGDILDLVITPDLHRR